MESLAEALAGRMGRNCESMDVGFHQAAKSRIDALMARNARYSLKGSGGDADTEVTQATRCPRMARMGVAFVLHFQIRGRKSRLESRVNRVSALERVHDPAGSEVDDPADVREAIHRIWGSMNRNVAIESP